MRVSRRRAAATSPTTGTADTATTTARQATCESHEREGASEGGRRGMRWAPQAREGPRRPAPRRWERRRRRPTESAGDREEELMPASRRREGQRHRDLSQDRDARRGNAKRGQATSGGNPTTEESVTAQVTPWTLAAARPAARRRVREPTSDEELDGARASGGPGPRSNGAEHVAGRSRAQQAEDGAVAQGISRTRGDDGAARGEATPSKSGRAEAAKGDGSGAGHGTVSDPAAGQR